jgi:hypothetical protein
MPAVGVIDHVNSRINVGKMGFAVVGNSVVPPGWVVPFEICRKAGKFLRASEYRVRRSVDKTHADTFGIHAWRTGIRIRRIALFQGFVQNHNHSVVGQESSGSPASSNESHAGVGLPHIRLKKKRDLPGR